MLCSELFETHPLFEADHVDVCNTTAVVNPWSSDVARMLTKESPLRALAEPGRFVIWPAEAALHQPVQIALKMDNRARRYLVFSSPTPNERATNKVGRFFIWVMDSANTIIKPDIMSAQMRTAFGVR
jgi:hypothetical protein